MKHHKGSKVLGCVSLAYPWVYREFDKVEKGMTGNSPRTTRLWGFEVEETRTAQDTTCWLVQIILSIGQS
jgi:hypothetical protein